MGISVAILIVIVLGSITRRLLSDVPNLAAGTMPDEEYDARFVRHPWLTYVHILPGALYMLGATLQLAYWFRSRHYEVHRRMGRFLLAAGLLTGITAVAIGVWFPFGGITQMSARVLFGLWFLVCLVLAFPRHPRRRHGSSQAVDDSRLCRWHCGRNYPHLARTVPNIWTARFPVVLWSGVLDLFQLARSGRRALSPCPSHAAGIGSSSEPRTTNSEGP
jgi:hypothetical protein